MKTAQKLIEIESLIENLLKKSAKGGLLKYKVLAFASLYENLSVSMIIEKLGIKKSNFALLSAELEREGLLEIKHAEIDRRCRFLKLTEEGRRELDSYFASVESFLGQTDLDTDNAIDILNNYLNKRI